MRRQRKVKGQLTFAVIQEQKHALRNTLMLESQGYHYTVVQESQGDNKCMFSSVTQHIGTKHRNI